MPSTPENEASTAGTARPSVFVSYASENRREARALRDALDSSGLDVWYDENELTGGDAWDQKIRRQIRECTYFMPVISAQTEARREGYFRREWRLAVDRSHDMADDAMFLIPVVIDGTIEAGARVPEKFTSVQWLKCPGGEPTAALRALATRLASGEPVDPAPAAPKSPARPRVAQPSPQDLETHERSGPPPMPPFPHRPADRHDRLRYLAEVVWWVLSSAWLIFLRFPKWVRVLIAVWLLFGVLFKSCSSKDSDDDVRPHKVAAASGSPGEANAAKGGALSDAASRLDKLGNDPGAGAMKSDFMKATAEIARAISKEIDDDGKRWKGQLAVAPFTSDGAGADGGKESDEVFNRVFSTLSQVSPSQVKIRSEVGDDAEIAAAAAKAGDDYILTGRMSPTGLTLRLLSSKDGKVLWTHVYPSGSSGAPDIADQASRGIEDALPKEPASP